MSAPLELPIVPVAPATAARISRERYGVLARRVKLLSWLSLVWMTAEGAIAIVAGIVASSIALIGFGLDSVVEGVASVVIIWRFTGARVFSHAAERRAQQLVAAQFFLLAPYVALESVRALVTGEQADVSWVGIGLAAGSVIIMPLLGIAKQRLANELGSAATAGEGRQNMLCAYLAGALLVGLLGNAAAGAWWLDPGVGLLIAGVAVKEGLEAWRGEGCCVSSPLDGAGFADERSDRPPDGSSKPNRTQPEVLGGGPADPRGEDERRSDERHVLQDGCERRLERRLAGSATDERHAGRDDGGEHQRHCKPDEKPDGREPRRPASGGRGPGRKRAVR